MSRLINQNLPGTARRMPLQSKNMVQLINRAVKCKKTICKRRIAGLRCNARVSKKELKGTASWDQVMSVKKIFKFCGNFLALRNFKSVMIVTMAWYPTSNFFLLLQLIFQKRFCILSANTLMILATHFCGTMLYALLANLLWPFCSE